MHCNKFSNDTYFLGCIHLSHKNICKGVSNWNNKEKTRDFKTLEDMDRAIINSINITEPDSNLFLLGDLLFGNKDKFEFFFDQIKCKNLFLIKGNHDTWINGQEKRIGKYFKWCGDYLEIQISKQHIVLFHYPISIFNGCHKGSWHICSHSHGTYFPSTKECKNEGKILDVGWDCFNKALSYWEVKKIMDTKSHNSKDHHGRKTF